MNTINNEEIICATNNSQAGSPVYLLSLPLKHGPQQLLTRSNDACPALALAWRKHKGWDAC